MVSYGRPPDSKMVANSRETSPVEASRGVWGAYGARAMDSGARLADLQFALALVYSRDFLALQAQFFWHNFVSYLLSG